MNEADSPSDEPNTNLTEGEQTGAAAAEAPFKPDGAAGLGARCGDVVILRGLLGNLENGSYKLFTAWTLDRWLEIPETALKQQVHGDSRTDSVSIVWVDRDANLHECHCAKACHFADRVAELDLDPTVNSAGSGPKYGGR